MRRLTKLGVLCCLLGAVAIATPTLGYETITADRTATVSVAADSSALLGIEATGTTPDQQTDAVVVEISNNAAEEFSSLTTDVTIDDPRDAVAVSDGFADSLAEGDTTGLELTCSGGGSDTATITVVTTATGPALSVENHEFSHTFTYSCTGSGNGGDDPGPASFTASAVDESAANPTQTFSFDAGALGNKETATIDLSDPQENGGIDYTTMTDADVQVTSGQSARSLSYDPATNTITYEAQGNVGGTLTIQVENFQIDSNEGGTVTYSDDQGRSDQDSFPVMAIAENGDSVETDGQAHVPDGETAGEIEADDDVTVGENANVNDGIESEGDVSVADGSAVSDGIESEGDVSTSDDVNLNGEVESEGRVSIGDGSTVGEVSAEDDVTVGDNTNVNGEIETEGAVAVESGSTVNSIDTEGAVTVDGATVNGEIAADGDVSLEDGATVNSEIETDGTVYVGCDVTTNGEIDAEGGQESTC